jgi:hypothetical protein
MPIPLIPSLQLALARGSGLLWALRTGVRTDSQTPQGATASVAGVLPSSGGQPGTAVAVGAGRQGNATALGSRGSHPSDRL